MAIIIESSNGKNVTTSSLIDANTSPDVSGKTVIITSMQTIVSNLTLRSDCSWRVDNGGGITVQSGITLTINGPFSAPAKQCFYGDGSIIFGYDSVAHVIPEHFGGIGDGVSACAAGINKAALCANASGLPLVGDGVYKLDGAVDLRSIQDVQFHKFDTSSIDASVAAITVGYGASFLGGKINIQYVTSSNTPVNPQVVITGHKSGAIDIRYVKYLQFYQDGNSALYNANAYNRITLGYCPHFHVKSVNGAVGAPAWFNENEIYGGRFVTFKMESSGTYPYPNNNNIFHMPTFEGAVDINISYAYDTFFKNCRFESSSASGVLTLDSNTNNNVFTISYTSAVTPRQLAPQRNLGSVLLHTYTDSGSGNVFRYEYSNDYFVTEIASINTAKEIILSDGTDVACGLVGSFADYVLPTSTANNTYFSTPGLSPGILGSPCYVKTSSRNLITTPYIPVIKGDIFEIDLDGAQKDGTALTGTTQGFRFQFACYGSDYNVLGDDGGSGFVSSPTLPSTSTTGVYLSSSATLYSGSATETLILRSEVKFVRIMVMVGTVAANSGFQVKNVAVRKYSKINDGTYSKFYTSSRKNLAGGATPTMGYAPKSIVYDSSGGPITCVYSHITRVVGEVAVGNTSVTLDDIGTVTNGDIVGVIMETGTTHWTTVNGVPVGSVITLATAAADPDVTATQRKILDQALIVIIRWL